MIVHLPDKNIKIRFPDDMPRSEMERLIHEKFYPETIPKAPSATEFALAGIVPPKRHGEATRSFAPRIQDRLMDVITEEVPTGQEPERAEYSLGRLTGAAREGAKETARFTVGGIRATAEFLARRTKDIQDLSQKLEEEGAAGDFLAKAGVIADPQPFQAIANLLRLVEEDPTLRTHPEYENKTAGFWEDVVRAAPQVAGQAAMYLAVGPTASMGLMGSQILGSKYERLTQAGVEPDRAFVASFADAVMEAPLERIGIGKAMAVWKPQRNIIATLRAIAEASGTEFLTEFAQEYPDAATNIWAENPDMELLEQTQQFIQELPEVTQRGFYAGKVGGVLGGVAAGAGAGVQFAGRQIAPRRPKPVRLELEPERVTEERRIKKITKEVPRVLIDQKRFAEYIEDRARELAEKETLTPEETVELQNLSEYAEDLPTLAETYGMEITEPTPEPEVTPKREEVVAPKEEITPTRKKKIKKPTRQPVGERSLIAAIKSEGGIRIDPDYPLENTGLTKDYPGLFVKKGGLPPDEMAQSLRNEFREIRDANDLMETLRREAGKRFKEERPPEYPPPRREESFTVVAGELKKGDILTFSDGDKTTVTEVKPGEITIQDGRRLKVDEFDKIPDVVSVEPGVEKRVPHKYFTLKKAQDISRIDFKTLSDEQLQKKIVILRDFNRYVSNADIYGDKLIEGGYFVKVVDPSAAGITPKDPWLVSNLRTALDQALAEKEARIRRPAPPTEKPPVRMEPWEMTREEWFNYKFDKLSKKVQNQIKTSEKGFAKIEEIRTQTDNEHKRNIQQALSEGKPVPRRVLEDYPDLAAKAGETIGMGIGEIKPTGLTLEAQKAELALRSRKKQEGEAVAPMFEKKEPELPVGEKRGVEGREIEIERKPRTFAGVKVIEARYSDWNKSGEFDPLPKWYKLKNRTGNRKEWEIWEQTPAKPEQLRAWNERFIEGGWTLADARAETRRKLEKEFGVPEPPAVEEEVPTPDLTAELYRLRRELPKVRGKQKKEIQRQIDEIKEKLKATKEGVEVPAVELEEWEIKALDWLDKPPKDKLDHLGYANLEDFGLSKKQIKSLVKKDLITPWAKGHILSIKGRLQRLQAHGIDPYEGIGEPLTKQGVEKAVKDKPLYDKSYGLSSVGSYATGAEQYAAPLKSVIDLPEMVEIARELMKGTLPRIKQKIWGELVQGRFYAAGLGRIVLKADIFKDIAQARAVLAHEIGHLVDYLPDQYLKRGNILGHIASLKKYLKRTLPRAPGAKEQLTEKDRRRLRYQAQKLIRAEYKDKWIDEEITRELPIAPDDVLAIWNSVEAALKENPELYRFIQMLNTAEKKAIVKEALKGQVSARVQQFAKKVIEKTGKKIKAEPTKDIIQRKYEELIRKEIEKMRLFKAEEMMDELKALSRAWKPFDPAANPNYTRYRYKPVELYADAISALFNAPGLLKSMAPNFYEGFFNYLERKPEVKRLYEMIQADIAAGTTDEKLTKRTYDGFKRGDDAYALALQKKYPYFDAMMRELVDAHWMVIKKVRQVGKENIDPRKNPVYKLEEMVYTGSEIEWMLGQTLNKVIQPIEKVGFSWDDFGFYKLLRRVGTERAEIANPRGWHEERALRKLDAMREGRGKQKWDVLLNAHKEFVDIRKYLIDKVEKAGRYDDQFLETMKENIGDYATFDVVKYIKERHGAAPAAKIFGQIGTFEDVANPATATLLKDIAILKAVNRQIAAESVVDFLKEHYPGEVRAADKKWNGKFHEIQDPPRGQDLGLIVYLKNGKPEGYYVHKWVADIFERNPIEGMWVAKALRFTAKPFRMVFTEMNPGFWLFNIHRDYFRAAQMLPKAKITSFLPYYLKGIKPAVKSIYGVPDDVAEQMLKNNMLISIESIRGLSKEDKEIERLLARYRLIDPKAWNQKILKPFGHFFNFFTNIGRTIERTPKVGAYLYLKNRFPDMPIELVGHLVRERGGSPDFLRLGRAYPIYNNLVLFLNAAKEGYRGDYAAMADNPAEFWYKKAKYIFLPKFLMMAAATGLLGTLVGDEKQSIKKVMDGVTDYDMANYIVVPLGLTPSGHSVYLRIPTDEGNRLLGGILVKGFQQDRPRYIQQIFDYMAGQAPTINPGIEALIDAVQYASGRNPYDAFRGRYAIPEQVFQAADERTHKAFAKWLANRSGATIVYRFKSDDIDQVKDELQKVLQYPILSNIVGRFIKVSSAGIREEIKTERELVKRESARKILDAKEVIVKIVNGEVLTDKDIQILAEKPDVLNRNLVDGFARKYGNVLAEELWSVFQTGSTEEKMAVLKKIQELDAAGRPGDKYRWLWQRPQELRR